MEYEKLSEIFPKTFPKSVEGSILKLKELQNEFATLSAIVTKTIRDTEYWTPKPQTNIWELIERDQVYPSTVPKLLIENY